MPHINNCKHDSLYRKFSGELTNEEILQSNLELQSHPNFKTIKYIINDFSDITSHSIEIDHTSEYAKSDNIVSTSKGKLKIALVIPTGSAILEASVNYRSQLNNSSVTCEIFSSLKAALKWATED